MDANISDLLADFGDSNHTGRNGTDIAVLITSSMNYVLLAITTWLLINIAAYGLRTYRNRFCSKGSWMLLFCYTGVLLNFARILLLIIVFHLNTIPGGLNYCLSMRSSSNCLSSLNLAFTYGLLWFRQRLFHGNELLRGESYNKYVTILSWVTLVMLFASPILVVFITVLSPTVGDDTRQCVYIAERAVWMKRAGWAIFFLTVVVQIFLLFLIIFPMAYMRRKSQSFAQKVRCKDRLLSTMKRCVIFGLIAVVTDVIFLSSQALVPRSPGYPVIVGDSILTINLVINDFCVIATFKRAPAMLTGALQEWKSARSDTNSSTWDQRTSTNDL